MSSDHDSSDSAELGGSATARADLQPRILLRRSLRRERRHHLERQKAQVARVVGHQKITTHRPLLLHSRCQSGRHRLARLRMHDKHGQAGRRRAGLARQRTASYTPG